MLPRKWRYYRALRVSSYPPKHDPKSPTTTTSGPNNTRAPAVPQDGRCGGEKGAAPLAADRTFSFAGSTSDIGFEMMIVHPAGSFFAELRIAPYCFIIHGRS
jgi:hypothetical protein